MLPKSCLAEYVDMSWQSNIVYRYRLDEKGVTILSDHTGILVQPAFLNFLAGRGKPYLIATSGAALLGNLNAPDLVIIGQKLEIPAFISNKTESHIFRYSNIPANGNTQIFEKLRAVESVQLLEFLDRTNPHQVLSSIQLPELLKLARQQAEKKELQELMAKIPLLVQQNYSVENMLALAQTWAEIQYKSYLLNDAGFLELTEMIDNYSNPWFENGTWQEAFFATSTNPKTVNKIIHKIRQEKVTKKALLCFDCMGLPEWLLLKDFLADLDLQYVESGVFSLMPSITSISRSAIFAGTWEVYHKSNPGQNAEQKDLKNFFGTDNTSYLREKDIVNGDVFIGYETVSVLFNFFDDLSHSAILQENKLTKFNYYNAVKDYLHDSHVKHIIQELIAQDFTLYICSDHGSTIARGNGIRIDKYLQDTFAKRGTIIARDAVELTNQKKINIPFVDDKVVVIPDKREMFADKNKLEINHGGITLDEMVVPFIKVLKE
jgi:hypothetical protein